MELGPVRFGWVLGVDQLLQVLIKTDKRSEQGWGPQGTLPETGTVQKGMEKPRREQSSGKTWCHQPLTPPLELWAPQRDPFTRVPELKGHGEDPIDPPQGSRSCKKTPGLC